MIDRARAGLSAGFALAYPRAFAFAQRRAPSLALSTVILVGLCIRAALALDRTNVLRSDEIFQYYEQGHRLAFGSGLVPWEFEHGVRSWLLPSLIAGIMQLCRWLATSPLVPIYVLRILSAAFSLSTIYFGFRMVQPKAGLLWAAVTGIFCATWYHAIFVSPSLLAEVFAAYLMLPAVFLASDKQAAENCGTSIVLGSLLGLALCLRFQVAPAVFVIACWYCRLDFRRKWPRVAAGALLVIIPIAGVLDYVTLGTPFQSIWLNFYMNVDKGLSNSFGSQPWYEYGVLFAPPSAPLLLPLIWLAVLGWRSEPLLALTSLAILLSHSLFAHKEYSFIIFVLLALPIQIGLGAADVAEWLDQQVGGRWPLAFAIVASIYVPLASFEAWSAGEPMPYLRNSGLLRSFVAAHYEPNVCGLGVADFFWTRSGGYTYFDRDVPLYYSLALRSTTRPRHYDQASYDRRASPMQLQMHVDLRGRPVVQFPGDSIFENASAFNYLVAKQDRTVPGYSLVKCFPQESGSPWPTACLLRRAGSCAER